MAASDDLLTRLRDLAAFMDADGYDPAAIHEAIAEIRRLRAQADNFDDEMRVAMERAEG
jgi:hypothetical protein